MATDSKSPSPQPPSSSPSDPFHMPNPPNPSTPPDFIPSKAFSFNPEPFSFHPTEIEKKGFIPAKNRRSRSAYDTRSTVVSNSTDYQRETNLSGKASSFDENFPPLPTNQSPVNSNKDDATKSQPKTWRENRKVGPSSNLGPGRLLYCLMLRADYAMGEPVFQYSVLALHVHVKDLS